MTIQEKGKWQILRQAQLMCFFFFVVATCFRSTKTYSHRKKYKLYLTEDLLLTVYSVYNTTGCVLFSDYPKYHFMTEQWGLWTVETRNDNLCSREVGH